MSTNDERPRVSWSGRRIGDVFTDIDGSVWQLQVDYNLRKVIPVKIQGPPAPIKIHTSSCSKPNIRHKF